MLVNGQVAPVLRARPGELERWRLVNACSSRFLSLRLSGQDAAVLGMDSGRLAEPESAQQLLLAPGNRADLLVTTQAGRSLLESLPYDRGSMMMGMMGGGGPLSQRTAGAAGHARRHWSHRWPTPGAPRAADAARRTGRIRHAVVVSSGSRLGWAGCGAG